MQPMKEESDSDSHEEMEAAHKFCSDARQQPAHKYDASTIPEGISIADLRQIIIECGFSDMKTSGLGFGKKQVRLDLLKRLHQAAHAVQKG